MTALPAPVAAAVHALTGDVRATRAVGGGCIAHATRVDGTRGAFFLKWATGEAGARFTAERAGLEALGAVAPAGICVPEVLLAQDATEETPGVLLTPWVEPGRKDAAYDARFGAALAVLHRAAPRVAGAHGPYGFPIDNTIGATPQPNPWTPSWVDFTRDHRLTPMRARLEHAGRWRPAWNAPMDRLLDSLDTLLPAHPPPSTLHGDLWSGNAYPATDGRAVLVDPAAHVGDREADLAMTHLFGGFSPAFYRAYEEAWPLEPGDEARRDVYQLYHLLNHVLLFGGGYAEDAERVLARLVG